MDENGEWSRLYIEELHSFCRSPNLARVIIQIIMWVDIVARMEDCRSAFRILTDKLAGKKSLGRSTRRWEDNI